MDLAGSNEGMDARLPCVAHGLPGGVNVPLVAPREAADDGHMAILADGCVPHLDGDGSHGIKVVRRGRREARLDDVDAEAGELARDDELLRAGHGGPRGLLPVAERGVEDANVVGVVDRSGTYSGRRGAARHARTGRSTAEREALGFAATAARPWEKRRGLAAGRAERAARLAMALEGAGFREEQQ